MSKFEKSLYTVTSNPKEATRIIADNMIKTRPRGEVVYRPYHHSEVYQDLPIVGPKHIDIKKLHPSVKTGDVVYISAILDSCDDFDAKINFVGDAKVVLNGNECFDANGEEGRHAAEVRLKNGENQLTFAVRCHSDDTFVFEFMPSVRYYWMWAKYYLLNVRVKSPLTAYKDEDGVAISRIYSDGEEFDGEYIYPTAPKDSNIIDFADSYKDTSGKYAYAITWAQKDTEIKISLNGKGKVSVCRHKVDSAERISLKKGECLLVKMERSNAWSFSFEGDGIYVPILKTNRGVCDKWLLIGTFGNEDDIDIPYGPECAIDFTKPYITDTGESTFWKLSGRDEYVRPCLATRFFGQWFYALMVGTHGLLRASYAIENAEYYNYFIDSTELLATYFDYMQYDAYKFGQAAFLELSTRLDNLDAIGSMGRNLCELYKLKPSEDVKNLIEVLADAAMNNIPRFEDGTYHRETDMWADDLFMSCPFLVRYALISGKREIFHEVVRQLLGFKQRLWMRDEKIMSHIFFLDDNEPNNIPWGRGNGWVYVSLSDALANLPKDIDGYDELMQFYLDFTEGIVANQDSDGLWHQVLNLPTSYQETSCTGMFMLGICRGVNNGWLSEEYIKYAERAYLGLIQKKVASDGNVYDVCMGSSNSKNVEYYVKLGTVDNDDHGTGVILTAIAEYIKIIK